MNILFVCSRNQWRSPTAEQVWRNYPGLSVKSAGTSRNAKKPISIDLLQWADVIFTMEQKHKNRIVAEFHRVVEHKTIHVLDIPDDYQYMDPELLEHIKDSVSHRLGLE